MPLPTLTNTRVDKLDAGDITGTARTSDSKKFRSWVSNLDDRMAQPLRRAGGDELLARQATLHVHLLPTEIVLVIGRRPVVKERGHQPPIGGVGRRDASAVGLPMVRDLDAEELRALWTPPAAPFSRHSNFSSGPVAPLS